MLGLFHLVVFLHFFQIPPIPIDITKLAPWLIMPAVLAAIANYVVNVLATKKDGTSRWTDQFILLVKFAVYLIIAGADVVLQLIPPDVLAQYSMPFSIFAGVIAAFIGTLTLHVANQAWIGLQYAGLRLLLGRDGFHTYFASRQNIRHPLSLKG